MKLFSVFFLVVSSLSFATSIRHTSLESIDQPLFYAPGDAVIIRVATDGEVFGGTCAMKLERDTNFRGIDYSTCEWTTVRFLSKSEIRSMQRNIDNARRGVIQYPDPRAIHCLAVPSQSISMTADMDSVLLKRGTFPCGSQTTNTSKGAAKLMELLTSLRGEYDALVD